jgi:PAS domain S-box-containing protein
MLSCRDYIRESLAHMPSFCSPSPLNSSCISRKANAILDTANAGNMKNILEIPGFDDAQQNTTARLIFLMSSGLIVASVFFVAIAAGFFPDLLERAWLMAGMLIPLCLTILWLLRRSKLQAAGSILLAALWLVTTLGTISAGGVSAPVAVGYIVVIALSALITRKRVGIIITLLSIAAGIWIARAEVAGTLPPAIFYSPMSRIFIYSFFFLVILGLQLIIAGNTNQLLIRSQKSETQYQQLLESIPTITYINSNDGESTTQYVSPQVYRLLGYSQDEFMQDPILWKKILHPEDRERVLAESTFTTQTGQPFQMEYRLISKDKGIVWVRDEAILVHDQKDAPLHWLGTWTDITTRKQAEEEQADLIGVMTKRTIQLQTGAEVSRAATSILDINILLPNVVELIRNHFDYYYVGIFLINETKEWAVLRAATGEIGKQMIEQSHRLKMGDSSMIGWCVRHGKARIALDIEMDAVQLRNPYLPLTRSEIALPLITHGEVIGAMTIQSILPAAFSRVDITALQSMADQVANAIDNARLFTERASLIYELETRNAELERFTYTVSHDLRSPLVTIQGFLGYLRDAATSNNLTRFDQDMRRIANAVDRMQILLNELLELSRIGRIINPPEKIPLTTIVDETINLINAQLEARQIRLVIQDNLPVVHGDHTRIIEIMQNLIGNAIKFMGDQMNPQIEIGTSGLDEDGKVIIFVRDNGVGIEPQYHERIFGLFNRLDPEIEGTGVGLTLVKRIIEVHGGRIWVDSKAGAGTTFFFTLPISEQQITI